MERSSKNKYTKERRKVQTYTDTRGQKKERLFGKKTHCNEMSLYDDMTNLNTQ
jgi:hypothetical protein